MDKELQNEWHLDRRVTLALIVAILLNASASVWWAASLNAEVLQQRKEIDQHSDLIRENNASYAKTGERLATIEAHLSYQTKMIERVEKKIDGKKE